MLIEASMAALSEKILDSPEPIDIRLWTRSGKIQSWHRCISSNMISTKAQYE